MFEQAQLRLQQLKEEGRLKIQQLKEQQRLRIEQQELDNQKREEERLRINQDLEKSRLESEASSKRLMEAFDKFQTNMHELLSRREKEVNAFYDQLDKWEDEVALTKKDRCKIMCEKLEQLPSEYDEHFFTLQYFIRGDSSWKLDRNTPEYTLFMSFDEKKEVDLNEMKKAALKVLPHVGFEGIRRFIDEIIGDGVPETYFVFC